MSSSNRRHTAQLPAAEPADGIAQDSEPSSNATTRALGRTRLWLPYVVGGSGVDVFTHLLARSLRARGVDVTVQALPHALQYAPWILQALSPPPRTDVILANSWNGFAFRRPHKRLIVVEHHCVFDRAYIPYRSHTQGIFHDLMIKRFEQASFDAADLLIAVSHYTAETTAKVFSRSPPEVIHNGIDADFFCPRNQSMPERDPHAPFRLLFVGNFTERKGAGLLAPIMAELGSGFELHCRAGLRSKKLPALAPNIHMIHEKLSLSQLRDAYRDADALLFPTRLEGFGYAAAEAMACGIPVIATHGSSLPEVVSHGSSGLLCPINDVRAFADAARQLAENPPLRARMAQNARAEAVARFSLATMGEAYSRLIAKLA
jgi:alpha-maltose-1-phosphate synthase